MNLMIKRLLPPNFFLTTLALRPRCFCLPTQISQVFMLAQISLLLPFHADFADLADFLPTIDLADLRGIKIRLGIEPNQRELTAPEIAIEL